MLHALARVLAAAKQWDVASRSFVATQILLDPRRGIAGGALMAGWWWLKAKTYVRDSTLPNWVNKDACVEASSLARFSSDFSNTYVGVDRSLLLTARPHFDLSHRERRVMDLRSLDSRLSNELDPCFLISREFKDLIASFDAQSLFAAECDVSHHARAPHGVCFLADAQLCVDGWDAFDRVRSDIQIKPGFRHDDGQPSRSVEIRGAIHFKPGVADGRAILRVRINHATTRVCVSDRLADAIFARELLGLEFFDASGDRKPPERYELYKSPGWEGAYPA
jgi:hypothetical protein